MYGKSFMKLELVLSVLGHYLTSSLSSLQTCINFITENSITKSSCRKIFVQATSISTSSSRRIFLAKNCLEWILNVDFHCMYIFRICYSFPHPLMGFNLICGSVCLRAHPTFITVVTCIFMMVLFWKIFPHPLYFSMLIIFKQTLLNILVEKSLGMNILS